MPLYSYFCEDEHETERISGHTSREDRVKCAECGGDADYRLTSSPHMANDADRKAERVRIDLSAEKLRNKGYAWRDIKCESCGFDDIEDVNTLEDGSVPKVVPCPECTQDASVQPVKVNIDRFGERFPYFDRGLGMWLTSKQHRKDVCRQRGLTPVEGDWEVDSAFRKWDDEDGKEEVEYRKYCDRLDNDPAFRDFRRQQERENT